jgi:hypothetical protein
MLIICLNVKLRRGEKKERERERGGGEGNYVGCCALLRHEFRDVFRKLFLHFRETDDVVFNPFRVLYEFFGITSKVPQFRLVTAIVATERLAKYVGINFV